jgi:hypothetical protein
LTDLSGYAKKSTANSDTTSGLGLRLRIAAPGPTRKPHPASDYTLNCEEPLVATLSTIARFRKLPQVAVQHTDLVQGVNLGRSSSEAVVGC